LFELSFSPRALYPLILYCAVDATAGSGLQVGFHDSGCARCVFSGIQCVFSGIRCVFSIYPVCIQCVFSVFSVRLSRLLTLACFFRLFLLVPAWASLLSSFSDGVRSPNDCRRIRSYACYPIGCRRGEGGEHCRFRVLSHLGGKLRHSATVGVSQGTRGILQGTFGIVQGTFGVILVTARQRGLTWVHPLARLRKHKYDDTYMSASSNIVSRMSLPLYLSSSAPLSTVLGRSQ
jgi:hypothetical protein